ncbi:MAG: hypothetical protein P1U86_16330 [Verrucomicrobiales bacterium]|nr:hypothetical protein [Verrucomicrobiales bacterium]
MKNTNRFFLTITSLALGWTGYSEAQVKIPANSAKSLENAPASTTTAPPAVSQPAFNSSSAVSRVQQPTTQNPGQKATITTSTQPVKEQMIDGSKVIAIQRVEAKAAPQSVATIKRLSELRRELNIAESASRARIVLPADELFEDEDPVMIDKFSEPVLKQISEYLLLTEKRKITLTSFYAPDQEDGKSLAWGRSLSLIEWFEDQGGLPADSINSGRPAPVESKTQKKFPNVPGERAFQNRIELNLE